MWEKENTTETPAGAWMVQLAKGLAYKYKDPSSIPRFLKGLDMVACACDAHPGEEETWALGDS